MNHPVPSATVPRHAASRNTLTRQARDYVVCHAAAWRVTVPIMVTLLILPFAICLAGAAAALAGKPAYVLFVREDGIAETIQIFLYLAAFIMTVPVARAYLRAGRTVTAILYVGLALGFVFMIGEELSWGQRILGWETPESYGAVNKQEETNLHNIYGVGATFKWLQGVVGAYGAILPLIAANPRLSHRQRDFLAALSPPTPLIPYFGLMFLWRIYRNALEPPRKFYFVVAEYNEVLELVLATGFVLFMVFQLRRAMQRSEIPVSDASHSARVGPMAAS